MFEIPIWTFEKKLKLQKLKILTCDSKVFEKDKKE